MTAPATITVLAVTAIASWCAFQRPDLRERWIFNPHAILARKEYYRIFTSGLIHADWMHFAFNAFSFYNFARGIEMIYGAATMLAIYCSAISGGSLLSLVVHRHHEYRALGASGGVCGIIFASIFLLPGASITMFPIPISLPPFLYAVLFMVGSFFAHRRQSDNIGHDAHLGGAIIGLLAAAALYPRMIFAEPELFATVVGLSVVILFAMIFDPLHLLKLDFNREETPAGGERERRYQENRNRNQKVAEMDALLDKVSKGGLKSLSKTQHARLEVLSRELHARSEPTAADMRRQGK
jgi:membrane associated rhomboid family serine protease